MISSTYKQKIRFAVLNNQTLTLTSYRMSTKEQEYICEIVETFLDEVGYSHLATRINYATRELLTNAAKANLKRYHFSTKKLNIENEEDYRIGIKGFNRILHEGNIEDILGEQKDLYIKVTFSVSLNHFRILIRNNCQLTTTEFERVEKRLNKAGQFSSLAEALPSFIDDTEGAGLGLASVFLLLRDICKEENVLQVYTRNGETVSRIGFVISSVNLKYNELLREELLSEIETLSPLPANITAVIDKIQSQTASINDISIDIRKDPALTANLLRTANSAAFGYSRTVVSIADAIKIIGVNQLEKFLLTFGVMKRLTEYGGEQKVLWDHSYRVACYAGLIAREWGIATHSIQIVYTAALLHDIGYIPLFKGIEEGYKPKLIQFCQSRGLPQETLEVHLKGLTHEQIGLGLCIHWNLPPVLGEIIRCHHHPDAGDKNYERLIYAVYLANVVDNYNNIPIKYEGELKKILEKSGIYTESDFVKYSDRLISKLIN